LSVSLTIGFWLAQTLILTSFELIIIVLLLIFFRLINTIEVVDHAYGWMHLHGWLALQVSTVHHHLRLTSNLIHILTFSYAGLHCLLVLIHHLLLLLLQVIVHKLNVVALERGCCLWDIPLNNLLLIVLLYEAPVLDQVGKLDKILEDRVVIHG
jgi:hypothetical protein